MSAPHYEVFQDEAGEYRWRLRAANGEVVAQSEGYGRKADAVRGAEAANEAAGHALYVLEDEAAE